MKMIKKTLPLLLLSMMLVGCGGETTPENTEPVETEPVAEDVISQNVEYAVEDSKFADLKFGDNYDVDAELLIFWSVE